MGSWEKSEGGKGEGGGHSHGKWCQTQAHGTGRRDERRMLEGAVDIPGWCHFAPGEEVGSMFKHREGYDDEQIFMVGVVGWTKNKKNQENM